MIRYAVSILFTVFLLLPVFVNGQVTANFTADDTAGCAPMVVHFNNTSTGATSYSWNLGNGTLSSLTNVSGAYLTAGTYTVTLVASNGSASNTRTMTIRVYALPTVNFTASDTTICPGGTVSFISTSSSGAWGGLTYNWNFGDGLTSAATSPSHTYASPGNYNVTLFATNAKGCINSRSRIPYIRVSNPPSVGFTVSNTLFCHPVGVASFTNTTIGLGPMINSWRFGDGGTSSLPNPTRNYTIPGIYDVSLKVTDGNGCIDSATYPAFITVGNLSANFTAPTIACPFTPVTFTNTSTTHLTSQWDFGDSTVAPDESPEHVFRAVGTYTVTLVVFDGSCFDTIRRPITITQPTGSFVISPAQPCPPPRTLTFSASVPPGSTVAWSSLMHGSLGSGTVLSRSFPITMVPTPEGAIPTGFIDSFTMIVTDSHGCKDTIGKRDTVDYTVLDIVGGPHEGCSPVIDSFKCQLFSLVYSPFMGPPWYESGYREPPYITSYPYPYAISSYSWNFGDGTPVSTAAQPVHTYTLVGGVYTASLTVVTANGCTATALPKTIKVGAMPPTPSFTLHPSRVCSGRPINFTASATGTFDKYAWDYGDGNSDTSAATTHIYTVPGIYRPELKLSYNGCLSYGAYAQDTVDSPNAVINYDFDCVPRTKVTFNNYSVGYNSHLWQFGDGTTSTAINPVHNYSSISNYTVTLTTHNIASGCRDTAQSIIKLASLDAQLVPFYTSICRDVADTFVVTVKNEALKDSSWVTNYKWYFDGVATDSLLTGIRTDTIYHAFNVAGTHPVMVVLTDNHGCFDTLTTSVLAPKPVDSFNFTPVSGCAPLVVTFTDHSTDVPGATINNYVWKFGDGQTAVTTTPGTTHVYTANGTYAVKQIVTDNIGCKDSLVRHTRVTASKPTAVFTASVTTVCARRNVRFTNTTAGTFTCLWLFGDGDTSTTVSPLHSYSAAGTYTVKLVVVSSAGCRDTLTKNNYITVRPLPLPSFAMDDSFSVCSPFSVNFTNTSTGATSYFWTFGDGTSSVVPSPTNVYITPAYYKVKLLAINSYSCTDTAVKYVNLFGYSGAFTYTPTHGCKPLTATFTATVSAIASAVWDFSDGVTTSPSLSTSATHVYSTTGMFIPKLILTDSAGCTNFSVASDTIKVDDISANFTTVPDPGCVNTLLTFNDTSSHYAPITSRLWTLAPGFTSTSATPTYTYTSAGTHPVTLAITDAWGCSSTITKNVTVNALPATIAGPSTVCVSTSATLTNAVVGGTWTSGNPSIATVGPVTGIVTGVAIGTVVITYSLGSGCMITKTVTVNPVLTAISGGASVCVGATLNLTNPTPGGTWTSGAPFTAGIGASSGVLTGLTAGVANISYSLGGCVTTRPVTVNALPSAIGGNVPVCVGRTLTLNCTPVTGTWISGSPAIASVGVTSGIVSALGVGAVSITYTLTTGCKTIATVTVNAPPAAISGSGIVCVGGNTTLTNSTLGGTWGSVNPGIATIGSVSGIVTGVTLGTALISYTAGGCSSVRTVTVRPLPSAIFGVNNVCTGQSVTLYDTSGSGTWSSASTFIATVSAAGVVTGVNMGATNITYTLGGGCTVTTPFTVNPLPASIIGSYNVCAGATTTFINPTPGGVWSSASIPVASIDSFTGIVTGGASGGATLISYTIPTGCTRTTPITVNAVPPIVGVRNMCAWGDTMLVSNANPAGAYSSVGIVVSNLGGGLARVVSNAPGVTAITYSLSTGCTLSVSLTVNPLPGPITGTTHVCQGGTTAMGSLPPGGIWNSADNTIATVDSVSGLVSGLSAGIVSISYTIPVTSCKASVPVTVTAIPYTGTISGPSMLCIGQTITLVDSFPGGVWSVATGATSVAGGNVTGILTGIDTVTYSIVNACGASSASRTVTVIPIPDAGSISGPEILCEGEIIQLVDTVAGGVWTSYNALATVSPAGQVRGVGAGMDTIYYTFTNFCGIDVAKHVITINPLPDAGLLVGPSSVCVGDTIVIGNAVSGGILGISNNNAALTGWMVKGVAVGYDTLSYSVTNSCGTAVTTKQIAIESPPYAGTITGSSGLCIGDTISLRASVPGGTWSAGNNLVALSGSVIVSGISAGASTVSYSISNNCGITVASQTVTVNPLPDGLTIVRNEYMLSVAAGYAAYQWSLNGKPVTGATNNVYKFNTTGTYSVMVVNEFGCSFLCTPYEITDCNVADIQVYPNPSSGVVFIQWCRLVTVKVSGMDGKVIKEIKDTNQVDIGDLPNGVYSLSLYDASNNKILTQRISKIR